MNEGQIKLYTNNPTRGRTDGTLVSESSQLYPVGVIVNTNEANYTIVKAALRCDTGFRSTGDTEIAFEGRTGAMWQAADDDGYISSENAEQATFTNPLIIDKTIGDTNHLIWLKVSSDGEEEAQVDTSVSIHVHGNAVPA